MNSAALLTLAVLAVLGCVALASLGLWWLADHRRGIAWAVSVVRCRFPDVSHLSPPALDAWLRDADRPAPQIVDTRSEEEFAVSHLASARRIAPESTAATALSILDPERPVVLYCSAGHRAATLARRLCNAGRRDVWNLEGGIFAWANAGLPIERAGQNTQRVHPYSRFFTRLLKPQKPDFRSNRTR
jgi:rhodanese-related sulfurtransferase